MRVHWGSHHHHPHLHHAPDWNPEAARGRRAKVTDEGCSFLWRPGDSETRLGLSPGWETVTRGFGGKKAIRRCYESRVRVPEASGMRSPLPHNLHPGRAGGWTREPNRMKQVLESSRVRWCVMENVGDFEDDEVAGLECQASVLTQASFHLFIESARDKHSAPSRSKNSLLLTPFTTWSEKKIITTTP